MDMEKKVSMLDPSHEVIYTPESMLRHPAKLVQSMVHGLLDSRELAWRLLVRNINARYRQSLLGFLWAFLPPILTTTTFVVLNSQKILNVGATKIPYPVYVMVGTLLWQGFVDTLNSPIKLTTSSKSMLAKINFPREALILAGLGEALFNFSIRLLLLIWLFIWFRIDIPTTAVWAPIGILGLMALGLMIGILLAPLGVLYQDIRWGVNVITTCWFFVTPVIYPPPNTWPTSLLTQINPVSPLLITTRELLTSGTVSQPGSFLLMIGVTFGMMIVGWVLYRLAMPHLIERIGA